jgi:hypothetical protein
LFRFQRILFARPPFIIRSEPIFDASFNLMLPSFDTPIQEMHSEQNKQMPGKFRVGMLNMGLALMRLECLSSQSPRFQVMNEQGTLFGVRPFRPYWWPIPLPNFL